MEIAHRLVPHLAPERMMGEALDFLVEPGGCEPLDRVKDPGM